MSLKPTIRNHYLPQMYLKSFLVNKTFWVYCKGGDEPIAQTPINTGVENNLYNIKNDDGTVNDEFEKLLSNHTENNASEIIKKLLKPNSRIAKNDISELAIFFSFLSTRVPSSINFAREIGEEIALAKLMKASKSIKYIQNIIDEENSKEDGSITMSAQELQKLLENPEEKLKLSLNKDIAMANSLNLSKDIYYELVEMNWCLCKSPSGSFFITSDNPVVPFSLQKDGTVIIGKGYGLGNVEVSIPLSPKICIYMKKTPIQNYIAVNKKFVKEINERTAWNAERFIISSIKTDYVKILTNWSTNSQNYPRVNRELIRSRFS